MGRCESCGKRDRNAGHRCWDCERTHLLDECSSHFFNDALQWCWCGSPHRGSVNLLANASDRFFDQTVDTEEVTH